MDCGVEREESPVFIRKGAQNDVDGDTKGSESDALPEVVRPTQRYASSLSHSNIILYRYMLHHIYEPPISELLIRARTLMAKGLRP